MLQCIQCTFTFGGFKLFSIIFCFICWFGLMLLDWVIVNFNIIFYFHDNQLHLSPKWDVQNRFYPVACFVKLILCVWYFHFPICRDTPLLVSTQTGIQLSLVTLYFCRNLQFHISRFLDPSWVSSCPHSSMPIIQFFHLYVWDAFQPWVFEMLRL